MRLRPPPYRFTVPMLAVTVALYGLIISASAGKPVGGGGQKTKTSPQIVARSDEPSQKSFRARLDTDDAPAAPGQLNFVIKVDLWQGSQIQLEDWERTVWARVQIYAPHDKKHEGKPLVTDYTDAVTTMPGQLQQEDIPYSKVMGTSSEPYHVVVSLVNRLPDGTEEVIGSQSFSRSVLPLP